MQCRQCTAAELFESQSNAARNIHQALDAATGLGRGLSPVFWRDARFIPFVANGVARLVNRHTIRQLWRLDSRDARGALYSSEPLQLGGLRFLAAQCTPQSRTVQVTSGHCRLRITVDSSRTRNITGFCFFTNFREITTKVRFLLLTNFANPSVHF